jgi:hypothetical protein
VPNDNAARGLLSVNQTNDAAWAAVFAGVPVMTGISNIVAIDPTNPTNNVIYPVESTNAGALGINVVRTNWPNGILPKIGDILAASALTVGSQAYLAAKTNGFPITDELVERIPQETLGLLKLGRPQFVIYAWGQSLRPKNLYSGNNAALNNVCTNYEITGEFLTRTVCHVEGTNNTASSPRIVIDSYNIEPGD